MTTNNAINTGLIASSTEIKAGTSTRTLVVPSALNSYMSDMDMTGFLSWSAGGPYFDDTTLGTFKLLVGGTGYIHGKLITWVAQNIAGMVAGNCYWIYIDNTGTIGEATARTDALYRDNIILFECLRDSTPVTNNQVTVKENHQYAFPARVETYLHDIIGTVIENQQNGANITLNGTQGVQINGADELEDEGLDTTIPDSGGVGVTWVKMYTDAGGKWARQNSSTTFTGSWNNAGTATALTAGRYGVYTLYVSKDNLNVTTPVYLAVLDTAQYTSTTTANAAISNGTTAKASNELLSLEMAQLGFIIYRESTAAIVQVTISKTTLKATLSTGGTNTASLVVASTTNFNGWLSTLDTDVQSSLDELDDSQRLTEVTGAAANLAPNRGVIANGGTLVSLTLPTVCKVGDEFEVVGKGAGKWLVAQNANQSIHWIALTTTVGVGGSLAATNVYDSIKFYCTVANLEFTVSSSTGNITIV